VADDRFIGAIEAVKEQVDTLLREVAEKKKAANLLAQMAGLEPLYADIEAPLGASGSTIKPDQFVNYKGPSAAARAYLTMRGKQIGAATVDTIYDALSRGGFTFNGGESQAKNGLVIAMGKDHKLRRLSNGYYGLTEWYPEAKRVRRGGSAEGATDDDGDESGADDADEADSGDEAQSTNSAEGSP
jgi:hypothetical protein